MWLINEGLNQIVGFENCYTPNTHDEWNIVEGKKKVSLKWAMSDVISQIMFVIMLW